MTNRLLARRSARTPRVYNDDLVRRRCAAVLAQVSLPRPWDLDAVIELVARSRGRRIVIERAPLHMLQKLGGGDQPSGMTCVEPEYDLILVLDTANGPRTLVITLHELAHLLLGHLVNPTVPNNSGASAAAPAVRTHQRLARSSWEMPREREAELLATMLSIYAGDHPVTGPASDVVQRATEVFGLQR